MKLTALEKQVIQAFKDDCYVGDVGWENPGAMTWADELSHTMKSDYGMSGKTFSGVMSSLYKKELVYGNNESFGLTKKGIEAAKKLNNKGENNMARKNQSKGNVEQEDSMQTQEQTKKPAPKEKAPKVVKAPDHNDLVVAHKNLFGSKAPTDTETILLHFSNALINVDDVMDDLIEDGYEIAELPDNRGELFSMWMEESKKWTRRNSKKVKAKKAKEHKPNRADYMVQILNQSKKKPMTKKAMVDTMVQSYGGSEKEAKFQVDVFCRLVESLGLFEHKEDKLKFKGV